VYLTHDDYDREVAICNLLKSGRIDGMILSVTSKREQYQHLLDLQDQGLPIIFSIELSVNSKHLKLKPTILKAL